MQRNNTASEHGARFERVLNTRKEKIRGLWKRGHKYYAQLRMEVGDGQTRPKMIPLQAFPARHGLLIAERYQSSGPEPARGFVAGVSRQNRRTRPVRDAGGMMVTPANRAACMRAY